MNCEQGDLAVMVSANLSENLGRFVTCVEYIGMELWGDRFGGSRRAHTWRIDQSVRTWGGEFITKCPDDILRPIRDQPGEDEVLRYAGLPKGVTA